MTSARQPATTAGDRPVSVLGLGSLGATLARALVEAGHPTTVWNRTPARAEPLVALGATAAATAADAVAAAPVVIVTVSTYDDVRAVLGPGADRLAGRVLVNLSSGTPEQARAMATWAEGHGAGYVDGAAMSGTRLIGRPEALFLYSGPAGAFAAAEASLAGLGRAVHLGADPGVASLYDTALLTMNLGLLAGYYHAVALVGSAEVPAATFASVATDYLPFAAGLLADHARQVDGRRYTDDDGTLDIMEAALGHVVATSRHQGIGAEVPEAVKALVERGIAAGHGRDGLASLAEVIAGVPA